MRQGSQGHKHHVEFGFYPKGREEQWKNLEVMGMRC